MLALGILIIIASFSIGSVARQIVSTAFQAMEVEQAEVFGTGTRMIIIVTGVLMGIAQVGIDISFLTTVISISFSAVLGAIALSFALGAKSYVANVLSSAQIRKIYQNGDTVSIDGVTGTIIEISSTLVIMQSEEGQITMPTQVFFEKQSLLVEQEKSDET